MDDCPKITYSRIANLGSYQNHKLEIEMYSSDASYEEISATTEYVIATVCDYLEAETDRVMRSKENPKKSF